MLTSDTRFHLPYSRLPTRRPSERSCKHVSQRARYPRLNHLCQGSAITSWPCQAYAAKLVIKGVPHEVGQGSFGLFRRQGPSLCGSTIERRSRIWLAELTPETRDRVASRQHSDRRISQVEKCERRAH